MRQMEPLIELLADRPPYVSLDRSLDGPFFELAGELPVAVQVGRENGRLVCTGVLVGWGDPPRRVTAEALRSVRLGELLRELGRVLAPEMARDAPSVSRRNPGPKPWPDSRYEAVASLYERALEVQPDRPVVWLAEQMNASRATVYRWLQRTRDKGFLPRTARRGPS
jgi:hypothetical protein